MHLWVLSPGSTPSAGRGPIDHAVAGLIGCVGSGDFGTSALTSLNRALALDSWSIYRVFRHRPPQLHASGSYRIPDTTADCFRVYQRELYRADSSFDDARACAAGAGPLMTHLRADELGAAHRDKIYAQYGMRERISLIVPDAGGDGLMAVNLYRHLHQRPFEHDDFDALRAAAPLLLACVGRHLELAAPGDESPAASAPVEAASSGGIDRLRRRCPALTTRELQICDRLLRGWTHDGVAADLGLSVATVKTYRNRAFDRLGIHFRSELFSLAIEAEAPH